MLKDSLKGIPCRYNQPEWTMPSFRQYDIPVVKEVETGRVPWGSLFGILIFLVQAPLGFVPSLFFFMLFYVLLKAVLGLGAPTRFPFKSQFKSKLGFPRVLGNILFPLRKHSRGHLFKNG